MKPLLALVAVGALAVPSLASDPGRVKATKVAGPWAGRTIRVNPPPLPGLPAFPGPESFGIRFMKVGFWPDRFVAELLAERLVCWHRLRKSSEEFHRFWMNNQPAVLNWDRLVK